MLQKLKFWYFSKGAGVGPLVKNLKFFPCFLIFGKINKQNVFDIILESQKAFLDYKKQKFEKVTKSGFFPRGLVHGFGKRFEYFFFFYCRLNRPGKCFCCYFRKESGVFRL